MIISVNTFQPFNLKHIPHFTWHRKQKYITFGELLSPLPPTSPPILNLVQFSIGLNHSFFSITVRFCCVATASNLVKLRHHRPDCWQHLWPQQGFIALLQTMHDPVSWYLTVPALLSYLWLEFVDRKLERECVLLQFFDGWFAPPCCDEVLDADTHQIKQCRGKAAWQLKKKVGEIKKK